MSKLQGEDLHRTYHSVGGKEAPCGYRHHPRRPEYLSVPVRLRKHPDATIGSSGVAEGKWSGILSVVASVQWGLLDEELSPDVYNRGDGDISHWKEK